MKFAMKVVKKNQDFNMAYVENEIKIHSNLNHPHIIKFFQYFEDDKYIYLI